MLSDVSLLIVFANADREAGGRNQHAPFGRTGFCWFSLTPPFEAMRSQKFIGLIKVVHIHTDCRHVLRYWCLNNINMKTI